jgi:pimeloyl-ACP methyl ester carboxylesterase
LPTSFRKALSSFSATELRESIVPLGRLIFGRPEAVSRLVGLDPARTLLMCGALDFTRTPAETIEMATAIGCRHVLIPEAGHISNLENPSFVTDSLLEWLAQQVGS